MNRIFIDIKQFLADRFSLQGHKADEQVIIESISENVEFKGANLFALICAIIIACIGLNVNSTAVIIGAMLISPIMGPVMGIGFGVGINNFELVKKGAKNLFFATIVGIITSYTYFLITPIRETQSELLARVSPTSWDVLIAFFGGLAGMVATARNKTSNVIPGVAIATALMPPLCTAGFGLATSNWLYFVDAIYLYFINSVFITISTFLITRYLKFRRKNFETPALKKKVTSYIVIVVIITILPSIYMTYQIVNKSIFESNARRFVTEQFQFRSTQVVSQDYQSSGDRRSIELLLIGRILDTQTINLLQSRLPKYDLKNVKLNIRQGLDARHRIDVSQIKASILEDVYKNMPQTDTVTIKPAKTILADTAVFAELKILYPQIKTFGLSNMIVHQADTTAKDTVKVALASFKTPMGKPDVEKIQAWLRQRYKLQRLKLVIEPTNK